MTYEHVVPGLFFVLYRGLLGRGKSEKINEGENRLSLWSLSKSPEERRVV